MRNAHLTPRELAPSLPILPPFSHAHILAISFTASSQVVSVSFSFSISVLAPCRPFPTAAPKNFWGDRRDTRVGGRERRMELLSYIFVEA